MAAKGHTYWCSKCQKYHKTSSKIGREHRKHDPYKDSRVRYIR